ncbi:YrhB domain-containing protein [Actinomadura sp. 21ATH]|uniref:YrhB domain-containing protein n=1 Tax=Actinomadura sp. 21ATH TaxID=1735444 RepID=UPI0035BEFDFA
MAYYNGTGLLDEPGFWAVHLSRTYQVDEAEPAAFGVRAEDVRALDERLADTGRWPVFRVELPGRVIFRVIYRNGDPDFGTDFVLSHPAWRESFTVTWLDGHPGWPGLSWPELCWVAGHPPPDGRWISEWERRLLLFLPCMGDAALPGTAADTVAEALGRVGVPEPAGLAARLLADEEGPSWYHDRGGALVCGDRWGLRSVAPEGRLTPRQARTVARAFTDGPPPFWVENEWTHPLAHRHPRIAHFMDTVLLGGGTLDGEIRGYVDGVEGPDIACRMIEEMQGLLADREVGDGELTAFVRAHAHRFIGGSGRRTLREVADRLDHAVRHPSPPHPFTRRAPNLSRLLREFTRGRGELDELVHAGADWLGVLAVRTAVREADALLDGPAVTDARMSEYVRSQSWWLVDDSGLRTVEVVRAALRRWALARPERNLRLDQARLVAERLLDQTWRRTVDGVVIDDGRTRERPDCWSFGYDTRAYLSTGDPAAMLAGADPLLVDRVTGAPRFDRGRSP